MSRPRIRTIKPEALQHRKVGRLSDRAFRLWICFITQADDEGRMVWDAEQFRILAFGYHPDVSTEQTVMALTEITTAKLVRLYVVGDTDYIDIPGWREHQKVDHPMPSSLPPHQHGASVSPREPSRALANVRYGSGSGSGSDLDLDRI